MARSKSSDINNQSNDLSFGGGAPVEASTEKEKTQEKQEDNAPTVTEKKKAPKRDKWKDRTVSAKVNNALWEDFKKCARLKGASCNGLLSMFISDYVNKTKKELQDLGLL